MVDVRSQLTNMNHLQGQKSNGKDTVRSKGLSDLRSFFRRRTAKPSSISEHLVARCVSKVWFGSPDGKAVPFADYGKSPKAGAMARSQRSGFFQPCARSRVTIAAPGPEPRSDSQSLAAR